MPDVVSLLCFFVALFLCFCLCVVDSHELIVVRSPIFLLGFIEFLQDQVSALQDKLSKYEDVGDVDVAKRKRKDNSGGGLRELNSYIEPAAFIEQPCTYRMALFAGV